MGPLLGGLFTEKVTVCILESFVILVAMGLLDFCSFQPFLSGPNHLLSPPETRHWLFQIETSKSRLSGNVYKFDIDHIYSCSCFLWRIFLCMEFAIGDNITSSRGYRIISFYYYRVEVCGATDHSPSSFEAEIPCIAHWHLISGGDLLLWECLLSTYLFPSPSRSTRWSSFELGVITSVTPPPNRHSHVRRHRRRKVRLLPYLANLDWAIIILYYGLDMASISSEQEYKLLSIERHPTHI